MTACAHGHRQRCPWPGCPAGIAGARRVVCGVDGVRYFARALDVVPVHPATPLTGRLVVRWAPVGAEEAR